MTSLQSFSTVTTLRSMNRELRQNLSEIDNSTISAWQSPRSSPSVANKKPTNRLSVVLTDGAFEKCRLKRIMVDGVVIGS